MNAQSKIQPAPVAKLREPFADHQISKLPKETRAQIDARKADKNVTVWKCEVCGGAHHKAAVHLDYVGHAALTDRLLDTDLEWFWEPLAFTELGLPAFDQTGGLWIKLTVAGVTRLGYGHAASKPNADPGSREKEVIGDALRNAAMRFGAALDLWHKGDLHLEEDAASDGGSARDNSEARQVSPTGPATSSQREMPGFEFAKLVQLVEATKSDTGWLCKHYEVKNLRLLNQTQFADAIKNLTDKLSDMAKSEANAKAGGAPTDIDEDSIPY